VTGPRRLLQALLALGIGGLAAHIQAQEPPAPPAPAASTAQPDAWRPKLVRGSCTRPEYPIASARAGEAGTSVVRLEVDAKGQVTRSTLSRSSGHARLDTAAADALSTCRFEPARDSTGTAVPSSTLLQHVWRLQDAAPDPWTALRAASGATNKAAGGAAGGTGRVATTDLAAVPFATATRATPEQRVKILRALQQEATEQASCGSVEQVSVAPWPAAVPAKPTLHPTTGREIPAVREMWSTRQCGHGMQYLLLMLFPEGEPASFRMLPVTGLAGGTPAP
jgi:TonB family protein